jgi:hypothetical protein
MIPFLLHRFVIHKGPHHLLLHHIPIRYSKSHLNRLLILAIHLMPLHLRSLILESYHLQLHHLFQIVIHLSMVLHFHSTIILTHPILHINQHRLKHLIIMLLFTPFFVLTLDEHIHRLVQKSVGHSFALLRSGNGVQ